MWYYVNLDQIVIEIGISEPHMERASVNISETKTPVVFCESRVQALLEVRRNDLDKNKSRGCAVRIYNNPPK